MGKNLERGLSLMSESQFHQLFETIAILDKRIKTIEEELNADQKIDHSNDLQEDTLPQNEKESKQECARTSHTESFQKTGIFGNVQSDDIIDSIGKIHIKSVRPKTHDCSSSDFIEFQNPEHSIYSKHRHYPQTNQKSFSQRNHQLHKR